MPKALPTTGTTKSRSSGLFPEKWRTAVKGLLRSVRQLLFSFIPSDQVRSLHPFYFNAIAVFLSVLLGGIFLALFLPGFYQQINTLYLSPSTGNRAHNNCQQVTISNTGVYLASKEGYWKGNRLFNFTSTAYSLQLTDVAQDYAAYTANMENIANGLQYIGTLGRRQDLVLNLVVWMSFVLVGRGRAQRFNMHASPINVFNRQKTIARIISGTGLCPVVPTAAFVPSTGTLSASFDISSYSTSCNSTLAADALGYDSVLDGDRMLLEMDVRSMITAMAVNIALVDLDLLELIPGSQYSIDQTTFERYYDPRYPEMNPISCVRNGTAVCVLPIGHTHGLPFFLHKGINRNYPTICNCTTLAGALDSPEHDCNLFHFISGVVLFNSRTATRLLQLVSQYTSEGIRRRSFQAMFAASYWGLTSNQSLSSSASFLQSAFQFCPDCVMLTFSSLDQAPDWTISEYYYQLQTGACRDSFSPSEEAWERILAEPYSPLSQNYEICQDTFSNAFINQAGVAMGNMGIVAPFSVFVILLCITLYQCCTGRYIPTGYDVEDKANMLDNLTTFLLLAKDHQLSHASLLHDLIEEMHMLRNQKDRQYAITTSKRAARSKLLINWSKLMASLVRPDKRLLGIYSGQYDMLTATKQEVLVLNVLPYDLMDATIPPPAAALEGDLLSAEGEKNALKLREKVNHMLLAVHGILRDLQAAHEQLLAGGTPDVWAILARTVCLKSVDYPLEPDAWTLHPLIWREAVFLLVDKALEMICLHTAIIMACPLQEVYGKYHDKVGYAIGKEVYLLEHLQELVSSNQLGYVTQGLVADDMV